MTTAGYSDRINHALAFAAKHHDQEVRKGTRLPYFTAPANVAIVLTRYGCDEATIVAAILVDAVGALLRDGASADAVHRRLGDKFGDDVLALALHVVRRRTDDDGVELSHEEQKADLLARLATAPEAARWIVAAQEVHDAGTLLADLRRTSFPESVWQRVSEGRDARVRWVCQVHDRLAAAGFAGAILAELREMARSLEERKAR